QALGFEATRAKVMGPETSRYHILHFATHAVLNEQRPALSGLVLSLVGRDGAAQEGFVGVHDIASLRLSADLVILSACRTALGQELRGEGLVGLTRAFMLAGGPRVLATLWQVDADGAAL